ncbi:MAG: cyclic nucleotide-binding domain-containing protein [Pseudomonadota bacterium]
MPLIEVNVGSVQLGLEFGSATFSYIALGFYLVAMLVRHELLMRSLLLAGTFFFILYYWVAASSPLWDAMIASTAIGLANLFVMSQIIMDRTTLGMAGKDVDLYRHFSTFSPGQFRKMMRIGDWQTATDTTTLCVEGEEPEHLFFVHKGSIVVERDGKAIDLEPNRFVGELSFMAGSGVDANATVKVLEGAEYVAWPKKRLRSALSDSDKLSNAFGALLNKDLSRKLHSNWALIGR